MAASPPISTRTSGVHGGHARLAALRRWRPGDADAIERARRDLEVAQAAALTAEAAALLRGEGAR